MSLKVELDKELTEIIEQTFQTFQIPNTIDNRARFIQICLTIGISHLYQAGASYQLFLDAFPEAKIRNAITNQPPEPKKTPSICPECKAKVIWNGRKWVCNCQVYDSPPETHLPPIDGGWSSSFPTE